MTQLVERPSLEALIEAEDIGLEVFRPGGIALTKKMIQLAGIQKGQSVLEIGVGTGVTACYLAESFDVTGIDLSDHMVGLAKKRAAEKNLNIKFLQADAHALPFSGESFDAVIIECVLTLLDKEKVLSEVRRVLKPGGILALQDIAWTRNDVPHEMKQRLQDLEGETTVTKEGWMALLESSQFTHVSVVDQSDAMSLWIRNTKKKLGLAGQLKIAFKVFKRWGIRGVFRMKQSESLFADPRLGYVLITAKRGSS